MNEGWSYTDILIDVQLLQGDMARVRVIVTVRGLPG